MAKIELELNDKFYELSLDRKFYVSLEKQGYNLLESMNSPLNFGEAAFRLLMKRYDEKISTKVLDDLHEEFVKEYDLSEFLSTLIEEYGAFLGTTQSDSEEKKKKSIKKI